jgi:hypothetical protein
VDAWVSWGPDEELGGYLVIEGSKVSAQLHQGLSEGLCPEQLDKTLKLKANFHWLAGISRDSTHKRRLTGGKKKSWRKKRK